VCEYPFLSLPDDNAGTVIEVSRIIIFGILGQNVSGWANLRKPGKFLCSHICDYAAGVAQKIV